MSENKEGTKREAYRRWLLFFSCLILSGTLHKSSNEIASFTGYAFTVIMGIAFHDLYIHGDFRG